MIEPEVRLVPTEDIIVQLRQRRKMLPGQIESLAESIARIGLINPILVNKSLVLIAGQCRLEAYELNAKLSQNLAWAKIPVHFACDVTPFEIATLELEENVKRHKLFWEDEARAVHQLHQMLGEDTKATAARTGLSEAHVWRCLQVATELAADPAKFRGASSIRSAASVVERQSARQMQGELDNLIEIDKGERDSPSPSDPFPLILCADFRTEPAPALFNFLHCDFPYGINKQSEGQDYAPVGLPAYEDSEETLWELCATLASRLDEICSSSCHIMFWFSMNYYSELLKFFRTETDFTINPFPLIWHKTDNAGIIPDPNRGPRRIYETALIGSRGDRRIVKPVGNAYGAPTTHLIHPSEKPEPMLRYFFGMFVDEHTKFLDPTCGSGNAVRAANSLGAKLVQGWEIDKEFAALAQEHTR